MKISNLIKSSKNFALSTIKGLRAGSKEHLSLDKFVVQILEATMEVEREEYLDSLIDTNKVDKSNGFYKRSLKSLSRNALSIRIPRSRSASFTPMVLEILKHNQEQINELVLKLYSKGLTRRVISEILRDFFGEKMDYSNISKLAHQFHKMRLAWLSIDLDKQYKVIFCDAIYITLRRGDSYSKEAVHIAYGVKMNNKRELLYIGVNPTESPMSWAECFQGIKERGVQTVGIVVADGLKGLENEVHKYFKGSLFQKCLVHRKRNILNKVRPKDKVDMAADLNMLFNHNDPELTLKKANENLMIFIAKWSSLYSNITKSLESDTLEYYFSYLKCPFHVRSMIATTNSIESLNKKIRMATRNKQSFEKESRLLDYIFVVIKDLEASNWMKYPVSSYGNWTGGRHNKFHGLFYKENAF